jgi:hypothetical protein
MSAQRGWIGDPQPENEWHTPGWLSEKGGPSHFHSGISGKSVDTLDEFGNPVEPLWPEVLDEFGNPVIGE